MNKKDFINNILSGDLKISIANEAVEIFVDTNNLKKDSGTVYSKPSDYFNRNVGKPIDITFPFK